MKSLPSTALFALMSSPLMAQDTEYSTSYSSSGHVSPVFWIVYAAFMLLMIAALWKMFTKAGQPGWGILIPIYNIYLICKIAGRPGWWLILMLIPFVNFIIAIILYVDIAKKFGKGVGFAIGMLFLPFIFFPILGFGSAQYQGLAGSTATTA
jgi:Family of unknown function (DUF5684)